MELWTGGVCGFKFGFSSSLSDDLDVTYILLLPDPRPTFFVASCFQSISVQFGRHCFVFFGGGWGRGWGEGGAEPGAR